MQFGIKFKSCRLISERWAADKQHCDVYARIYGNGSVYGFARIYSIARSCSIGFEYYIAFSCSIVKYYTITYKYFDTDCDKNILCLRWTLTWYHLFH